MDRILDFLLNTYGPTPYFIVFLLLMAAGLGLPVPEDLTLVAAGAIAYYGETSLGLTIAVAYVGILAADTLIYSLGRIYGRRLTKIWFFHKILPDDRLVAVQNRFHRKGNKLIFLARFMPGLRAAVFFSSGTLRLPYRVFLSYDGLAAAIGVPAVIGGVYVFGAQLDQVVRFIQRLEHGILLVIVLLFAAMAGKWYWTHRRLGRGEMQ